jgi:NAD(P)-dependent dehydrogenase (short-subunit alcohol dehydrogenase family)
MSEIPREDFQALIDVHMWGTYNVVRPAFPLMRQQGYGRIVLTSSISGIYGVPRVANYAVAKTGMIGLCNVLALEGAADGVKCNVIVPGSITRMAAAYDTSQYPKTMAPEMVAPAVGWLAHEACSITGEMLASIAGRIAKVFIAESPGVYRDDWTIGEVGEQIEAIRDARNPVVFPIVPSGQSDHIRYSFEMARAGEREKA